MCGIVGYIGNRKAREVLIDGLKSLEYRGYDSAGIATIEKDKVVVKKEKGRVENVTKLKGFDNCEGNVGIAHTRWATHGVPSKENAHPHLCNDNTFAVVHNGIIENYAEIKEFLENNGYTFLSQTDTEVIPNLIHYYYQKDKFSTGIRKFIKAVSNATNELIGSYAIEVISSFYPETVIVTRKNSPLVIGEGNGENFIASDIPAILKYTKKFYFFKNEETAIIYNDKMEFHDISLNPMQKEIQNIEWDASSSDKEGYEDYMLKEIFEQPKAIRDTIGSRLSPNGKCQFEDLNITKEYLKSLNKIYIVECGTAMHAGLVGKKVIEKLCKIPVEVDVASEFRYMDPLVDSKTLFICISQSGETADTLAGLRLAKSKGAKTLAIVNAIGSTITREADYSIYTHAGPEIAVASTKAYTSQVVLISILGIFFAETLEGGSTECIEELKKEILQLPNKIEETLKQAENIKELATEIYEYKDMFFLGRENDYNTSMEGSLKLKEISYIHSEAYPAGELKHGPIALIENGITVVGIITDKNLVDKTISNLQEVISRGAKIIIITNQNLVNQNCEKLINIPSTHVLISPVLSIIPIQLLSYYITKLKGLDVDKPRNLAKSVTVE